MKPSGFVGVVRGATRVYGIVSTQSFGPFVDVSTARPTGRHLRASEPPNLSPSSTPRCTAVPGWGSSSTTR